MAMLVALVLLLVPLAGAAAKKDPTLSKFDNAHIPWYNDSPNPLRHEGVHNDLGALLLKMQEKNWVSVFVFNQAVTRWALNCIYSYIKFGKGRNYIVAASDESSLQVCIKHRLPCYNASWVFAEQGASTSDAPMLIHSRDYNTMVWGKIHLLQRVLQLGYNVHFSDVDVVYLRPVWPSYRHLFLRYQPDSIFMKEVTMEEMRPSVQDPLELAGPGGDGRKREDERESWGSTNLFNTGVYAMRSNNATRSLVAKWLATNNMAHHDQWHLNERAFKDYVVCDSLAPCQAARSAGWPTVYRHPTQFGRHGACPGEIKNKFDVPCEPLRLFVHMVCLSGWDSEGEQSKGRALSKYRLWLIDEALRPIYNEDDAGVGKHPFLPCEGVAWVQA